MHWSHLVASVLCRGWESQRGCARLEETCLSKAGEDFTRVCLQLPGKKFPSGGSSRSSSGGGGGGSGGGGGGEAAPRRSDCCTAFDAAERAHPPRELASRSFPSLPAPPVALPPPNERFARWI